MDEIKCFEYDKQDCIGKVCDIYEQCQTNLAEQCVSPLDELVNCGPDNTELDAEVFRVVRENVGRSKAFIMAEIKAAVPDKKMWEIANALERLIS